MLAICISDTNNFMIYHHVSNISRTLVGAAATTSSFST